MIPHENIPYVAVMIAGLIGGIVRGYSGFGFGMAAVPIAMLSLPPVLAIPAVLILEMMIGLFTARKVREDVAWHPFGWLFAGTLIGTPLGLGLLAWLPAAVMRPIIGLAVLISVCTLWLLPQLKVKLEAGALGVAGMISGVLNGVAAASGPPAIILLLASDLPSRSVRGTLIFFILASSGIAVVISGIGGLMVWKVLLLAAAMIPSVLVGTLLGSYLFSKAPTEHYRQISLMLLLVISVFALAVVVQRFF